MILQLERSRLKFPGPGTAFRCVPAYFNPCILLCPLPSQLSSSCSSRMLSHPLGSCQSVSSPVFRSIMRQTQFRPKIRPSTQRDRWLDVRPNSSHDGERTTQNGNEKVKVKGGQKSRVKTGN